MPRIQSFLVHSELSVLLCALGLGVLSHHLLKIPTSQTLLLFLSVTAFFFYTLERNLTLSPPKQSIFPKKSQWITDHPRLNIFLLLVSGGVGGFLFFTLELYSQISFISMGVIALGYSIIRIPHSNGSFTLREIYYLKPVLLSLVWVYFTLFLPLINAGVFPALNLSLLSIIWFSWIFTNGLFFDIRDLKIDSQENQTTLAMVLGRKKTHQWINQILLIQFLTVVIFSSINHNLNYVWILMLGSFSFWVCNLYLKEHKKAPLTFFIFADLTLILPSIALNLKLFFY